VLGCRSPANCRALVPALTHLIALVTSLSCHQADPCHAPAPLLQARCRKARGRAHLDGSVRDGRAHVGVPRHHDARPAPRPCDVGRTTAGPVRQRIFEEDCTLYLYNTTNTRPPKNFENRDSQGTGHASVTLRAGGLHGRRGPGLREPPGRTRRVSGIRPRPLRRCALWGATRCFH